MINILRMLEIPLTLSGGADIVQEIIAQRRKQPHQKPFAAMRSS